MQNKLTLNWTQQNNKEIEILKANLTSSQEIVKLSMATMTTNNQQTMSKCIEAVDFMWKSVLEIREYVSPISTFYSVLLPHEYDEVISEQPNAFQMLKYDDASSLESMKEIDRTEVFRPYLGEYIWSLFFSYRAYMYRTVFLFQNGKVKGKIPLWYEDTAVINIAKSVLGEEQFSQIRLEDIYTLPMVISMLEQKLLIETNKLITGSNITESNFNEAKRLMKLSMNEKV